MRLRNKKIAYVTTFASHYRVNLFNTLLKEIDIDYFFFIHSDNKTKKDIAHLQIHHENHFHYLSVIAIIRRLFTKKYDVIIKCTNNQLAFWGSFLASKIFRAKFIVWHTLWSYPDTLFYKVFTPFFIWLLNSHVDSIVVYGEHGKEFLIKKGISADKIFVAWQTVDNNLYGRDVDNGELFRIKSQYSLLDQKKIILYVGRLQRFKGLEYFLEALSLLDKSQFALVSIGHGYLENYMQQYCDQHGIEYHYVGLVRPRQLPPFYKIADVLVLPSITTKMFKEPWGLVVNEAFNQGCPVVVTDAVGAGVGGLVDDDRNGYVVPEQDAQALAGAITKIISDEQVSQRFSENAKNKIASWTYDRQSKGFLDAIEYALEN